jgi:immune inhibitor A
MRRQRFLQIFVSFFVFGINLFPLTSQAQITCLYPPPHGGDEAIAAIQRESAGMKLQAQTPTAITTRQAAGAWRAVVLLIDFPDYRWHTTNDSNFVNPDSVYASSHFQDMLFSLETYADPLSASGYTGSLRDFYRANSYGRFDIEGDVAGWFTAPNEKKYYVNQDGRAGTSDDYGFGPYPNNAQGLVEAAVQRADATVDFSRYDNNRDGIVDALFVVHAGPGAEALVGTNPGAAPQYMWSHFSAVRSLRVDNVIVQNYAFMPEDGAIGVFCHEFGHNLGLPDLYDPDRSSEGVGEWCLMGSGSWCHKSGDRLGTSPSFFSAWSRLQLGWVTLINFNDDELIRLPPAETSETILLLQNSALPNGEYFLLENRQPRGFDAGLTRRQKDFGLAAPNGLMIYHVDEAAGSTTNDRRRLLDVEEASPYFESGRAFEQLDAPRTPPSHRFLNNGNRGDNGDPFPGFTAWVNDLSDFSGPRQRDRFDDESIPSSRANSGAPTGISVSDIALDGEDVLFRVRRQAVTAVNAAGDVLPHDMTLRVFPNPARGHIRFIGQLPEGSRSVTVRLFDLLGREVFSQHFTAPEGGRFAWVWQSPPALPAGMYWALIEARDRRAATKVVWLN